MKNISLYDVFKLIWKKRTMVISVVITVAVITAVISFFLPKKFKATAIILTPESSTNSLMGINANLSAFGLGDIISTDQDKLKLIAILQSNQLYRALNNKFDLETKYGTKFPEYTYDMIRRNLRIEEGDQDQIIISMIDKDQNMVSDMVNYVVHCLDSINIKMSTRKAKNDRMFIERRLEIVNDSLEYLQDQITGFMKENDILDISEQVKYAIENAATLKAQITAKEIELTLTEESYTENSPNVLMLKNEIDLLEKEYNKYFTKNDNLFIGFSDVPELQIKYLEYENKILYLSKLLEFIGTQYEKAKIDEAKDVPTIQILDKAQRPNIRFSPKRAKLVIITSLISFLLISFLIIVIENYKSHVR